MSSVASPEKTASVVVQPRRFKSVKEIVAQLLCPDATCGDCIYTLQDGCYNRSGGECGGRCSCPSSICGALVLVLRILCPSAFSPDQTTITRACTSGPNPEASLIEALSQLVLVYIDDVRFWKRITIGLAVLSALLLAGLAFALLRLNGLA
jgi:hypothetical protein